MQRRSVVVTGLGLVTSLAESAAPFWSALTRGHSGIRPITRWDTAKYPVTFGGECTTFDPARHNISHREIKRQDRFSLFAVASAMGAVQDAGLDPAAEDPTRCGVIIGSGMGGIETLEEQHKILLTRGLDRMSALTVPKLMINAAGANVSILYNFRGPNAGVSTACSTGSNAVGDAVRMIQYGLADVMIAGGSEAVLCEMGLASFCAARALSTRNDDCQRASRPFDKDRDGFVLSEGCGILVLESLDHARKRSARPYAEIVGYGTAADAHHIVAPEVNGEGAAQAMRLAMEDAGINPQDVAYLNAHGTSTTLGDLAETRAVKAAFGQHAYKLCLSSSKSQIGHLLGASGAVAALITALSLRHQTAPPTINLDHPDPDCDLDYVPHTARDIQAQYAMCNSFAFGGHNTSLLLKAV